MRAVRGVGVAACVAMSLLLMASMATAAPPKCRIVNAGTGQRYKTLQAALDAPSPGDTLKGKGTCDGDTTIHENLTIVGEGHAVLNGANNELTPGSVVVVNGRATVALLGLTVTGGTRGHP